MKYEYKETFIFVGERSASEKDICDIKSPGENWDLYLKAASDRYVCYTWRRQIEPKYIPYEDPKAPHNILP